jgi:hypothetical protein
LVHIETVYSKVIANIEDTFNKWQKRISNGQLIGKFSERLEQLLKQSTTSFKTQSSKVVLINERLNKLNQIKNEIKYTANIIFNQQLQILQTLTKSNLKVSLLSTNYDSANNDQLLRNSNLQFSKILSDLESTEFDLKCPQNYINNFTSELQAIITEFPETPEAKLLEIKVLEKSMKTQKKAKNPRGINFSFNLVGMLRPPGIYN